MKKIIISIGIVFGVVSFYSWMGGAIKENDAAYQPIAIPVEGAAAAFASSGNESIAADTAAATVPAASGGTWTPLATRAPSSVQLLLLLSDGTVMAKSFAGPDSYGNVWYKLTPDIHGSYVNGTWTTLSPMNDTRLYFSSKVVADGRVFVAGGEYPRNTGGGILGRATAEIYDPVADAWTRIDPPTSVLDPSMISPIFTSFRQAFVDSVSEILPNGKVLVAPVAPKVRGGTVLYDPATNAWSAGPILANNTPYQDEASWVKLPDNSIFTIDPFGTNTERYIPSTNAWVPDSTVPVSLYDPFGSELGAAFLLPNGKVIFLGSTGHTAIYTPSGTTSPGAWVAGPDIPNAQGTPDAAGAMMASGRILCAVSPIPTSANHFPSPTSFYEYDYVANSFAQVSAPVGSTDNISSYLTMMLDLPDGTVLYSHFGDQLYDYAPNGSPLASGKPTISTIQRNADSSYHLTGTLLNGISEGAAYGDDNQMATNYPLVRLTASNSNVYYARTYNWSSTGVMTGNAPVTTEFRLPAGLPAGTYSGVVVANGISSDPFPLALSGGPPLLFAAAVSRKTHAAIGDFDISLPLTGSPGVECRTGGVNGDYRLVITFTNPVASGNATVTSGMGSVAGGPSFSGNTMTVNLTGVANAQTVTVSLSGVTDSFAQVLPNTSLSIGILLGDTNGDRLVNVGDALQTRNRSGQTTDATNFRSDVNTDGSVNTGDALIVRSGSGTSLP